MNLPTLNLVYFSPTHTTQKVLAGLAEGIPHSALNHFDLTLKSAEQKTFEITGPELTLFGAPVYAGRLPLDAVERFKRFRGKDSPAIVVVTYGNREFDDALLELKHLVQASGFIPLAAAAFIGQHSFSTVDRPIAPGRPDKTDLAIAREYGKAIHTAFSGLSSPAGLPDPALPGHYPYKERKSIPGIAPVTEASLWTRCYDCVTACPTQAISPGQPELTDNSTCIHCCACVNVCPTGARTMTDPNIDKTANWLYSHCSTRKEPELFL